MSAQIIQLEESLGLTLFHRRPFALTPAGQELYDFIRPFYENLGPMAEKLRGGVSQHIRIGASEIVLRDYLPSVVSEVRKKFPKLRLTLREGYHPQLFSWLQKQELDMYRDVARSEESGRSALQQSDSTAARVAGAEREQDHIGTTIMGARSD